MGNKRKSSGQIILRAAIVGIVAAALSAGLGYGLTGYEQRHDSGPFAGMPGAIITMCAPFIGMLAAAITGMIGRKIG